MKKEKLFDLLLKKFKILKELVYVLDIPYRATLEFQNQKLTLSDVYGRWISMQLHLNAYISKSSYKTGLAECLYNALQKRKEVIFTNPLMSCALFLDPRFHIVVARDQNKMHEARENLLKIWRRMHVLHASARNSNNLEESGQSSNIDSFEFDEAAAMNQFLGQSESPVNHNKTIDIEAVLDSFQLDPLPVEKSVLEYWESAKEEHEELIELAMVVFCVPPTEVQVERDFSHLDHIFTDRRCRLTEERLDDILLLHLNKDLFFEVNASDRDMLFKQMNRSNETT